MESQKLCVHKKQIIDAGKAMSEPIEHTWDMILGFLFWYLSEIIPPINVERKPKIERLKALMKANSALWNG